MSPSNQPWNKYAAGFTNEKAQTEAIAKLVQQKLAPYAVDVVLATLSLDPTRRDDEAKSKGCTHYLAIHTNAGGGKAQGAVAFYHPSAAITKTIATALVNCLNSVNPNKENRASQVVVGTTQFNGVGYGEIREPYRKGIKPVLLEVDFHDNKAVAKWIINNKATIADAIVKGLVQSLGLKPRVAPPVKPPVTPTNKAVINKTVYGYKTAEDAMADKRRVRAIPKGTYPIMIRHKSGAWNIGKGYLYWINPKKL